MIVETNHGDKMSYTIENYNKDGFEVTIGYDDHAEYMFDELWHGVSFISNHRDYADKGDMSHIRIEALMEGDIPEGYEVAKVNAYIHGGIALSLGDFSCPWDSGVFGFLLFKTGEFGDDNQGLEGFVKHWTAILNGHIYYFTIENETEIIESCNGFDCMDYMKEEIDSIINSMVKYDEKQRVNRLKAQIKHKVPLDKRIAV